MAKKLRAVMASAHLSSTARLAYLWLHWTARNGVSHATSSQLCERIGVGTATITNAARELENANLVLRVRAGAKGTGRTRWILLPALLAAIAGSGSAGQAQTALSLVSNPNLHFADKRRKRNKRSPSKRLSAPTPNSVAPQTGETIAA